MKTKELIEKQRELIEYFNLWGSIKTKNDAQYVTKLGSEIATLEAEIAKRKDEPKMSAEDVLVKIIGTDDHKERGSVIHISYVLKAMECYADQFKH